jgi:phage terminase large subunit-like protein
MIKRRWLRYYDRVPEKKLTNKVIQSWDCASKEGAQNDWSVCTTWLLDEKKYYLLNVYRERLNYPRLREAAIALAKQYEPTAVLIEDTSAGSALAQELVGMGFVQTFR